jgi:hypothetical protein
MKTYLLPILLMSAAVSFANEAADDRMNRSPAFESQLSRSAVQSEFMQARADGTLPDTSETGSMFAQLPPVGSAVAGQQITRAQVHAEYLRAKAEGTLPDTSETGSVYASLPVTATGRARAEVYAVQAAQQGSQY